jgi:hypothetical protein
MLAKSSKRCPLFPVIFLILLAACTPTKITGFEKFIEPEPATYVSLLPVVNEYFYLRKQATISGSIYAFYQRYPDLAHGPDLEQGINTEAHHVSGMRGLTPIDGNIFPEYYEPLRIFEEQGEIQVHLHGMEMYLWQDQDGNYNNSGGEFKIVLFLRQEDAGWQIYQTDEVTLQEWKNQ